MAGEISQFPRVPAVNLAGGPAALGAIYSGIRCPDDERDQIIIDPDLREAKGVRPREKSRGKHEEAPSIKLLENKASITFL
jgi:hypothetical protein